MWILNILALNIAIVFITELPICFLMGAKTKYKIITAALINITTNPAAVMCGLALALFLPKFQDAGIFLIELFVVFIEGFMFSRFKTFETKNSYLISLLLNFISYIAGEITNIFL